MNRLLKAILDELRQANKGSTTKNLPKSSPSSIMTRRQRAPVLPSVSSTRTELNLLAVQTFERIASEVSKTYEAS